MTSPRTNRGEQRRAETKKGRKRVRLFQRDSNDRWGSEFTDSIYMVRKEDGTFRLYARKYFNGETVILDRVCGIQTPLDFAQAFSRISNFVENDGIRWVAERVALLDKSFAKKLESYLETLDSPGNKTPTQFLRLHGP